MARPQFGASQYTPRLVLRFRRDTVVKNALGIFIAPALYALVSLVDVGDRERDDDRGSAAGRQLRPPRRPALPAARRGLGRAGHRALERAAIVAEERTLTQDPAFAMGLGGRPPA